MGVTAEQRGAERVIVVDGDLACPATLVQLRAALSCVSFSEPIPVVVDLTAATGSSAGTTRLLNRTALVMAHRGVGFRVDAADSSGLLSA